MTIVADIADDASLMQKLRVDHLGAADLFRIGKVAFAVREKLAPLLRRVVFLGVAAFGAGFDLERISLRWRGCRTPHRSL
jgi:hypothetical protein